MAAQEWQIEQNARHDFDRTHPKPKWDAPTETTTPLVIRHNGGRLWWEATQLSYPDHGSAGELHITFQSKVESGTMSRDQLLLMREELDRLLVTIDEINRAKQAHLQAVKDWENRKEAAVQEAVKVWRKEQRAEKKAARNSR